MRSPRPVLSRWWPVLADPLLGAAITVLFVVELVAWGAEHLAGSVLCAVAAGAGLALRRRTPLLAFVLSGGALEVLTRLEPGFDNDSAALVVTFFVSLYSLGRHAIGLERWLGVVAVLFVIVDFIVSEGGVDAGNVAFSVVFVGAPWGVGLVIQLRRDRERTLTEQNRLLAEEQETRAQEAVAAERARIARELHDVVSHAIAVTVLQARGARKVLGSDEGAVRQALDAIDRTNTQALSDMRRLLSLLRDAEDGPQLGPQPSIERLPQLMEEVRGSGLPVELSVRGATEVVPPGVDLSAYRIVQEALTNVLKHAGPTATATVDVEFGDEALLVRVADDGPGTAAGTSGRGHGLLGIRERVAVVGGEVHAGPEGDAGFVVRARLPYTVEL